MCVISRHIGIMSIGMRPYAFFYAVSDTFFEFCLHFSKILLIFAPVNHSRLATNANVICSLILSTQPPYPL